MRFWDSSAIVPLLVTETSRERMLDLLAADPEMAVWWGTPVECTSAIVRREREGDLESAAASDALGRLRALLPAWHEVQATEAVRTGAMRVLRMHPLRAADALQLGAALAVAQGQPAALDFVCLDSRLCLAADREGLRVVPDRVVPEAAAS